MGGTLKSTQWYTEQLAVLSEFLWFTEVWGKAKISQEPRGLPTKAHKGAEMKLCGESPFCHFPYSECLSWAAIVLPNLFKRGVYAHVLCMKYYCSRRAGLVRLSRENSSCYGCVEIWMRNPKALKVISGSLLISTVGQNFTLNTAQGQNTTEGNGSKQ